MMFGCVYLIMPSGLVFVVLLALSVITLMEAKVFSSNKNSYKKSLIATSMWITTALVYTMYLAVVESQHKALKFFTAYLLEFSLSMDNIFIFIIIFETFKLSIEKQHKVLSIGVISAIIMRCIMIFFGLSLLKHFAILFVVMGFVLFYHGVCTLISGGDSSMRDGYFLRFLKKRIPMDLRVKDKFFVRKDGVLYLTAASVALIMVENADLIFAIDSIAAIVSITRDFEIILISNSLAIFGIRSLYFCLFGVIKKFEKMMYAISVILIYIGIKLILIFFNIHIPLLISLVFIFTAVCAGVIWSTYSTRCVK